MNKLIITLSKVSLVLLLSLYGLNLQAQQAPKEDQISNNDLIKLATKAPFRENFSSEQDYSAAKEAWIKEYPDANKRIVGSTSKSQPSPEELNAIEQKKAAAKQAWISAHPEEYERMLSEGGQGSIPLNLND